MQEPWIFSHLAGLSGLSERYQPVRSTAKSASLRSSTQSSSDPPPAVRTVVPFDAPISLMRTADFTSKAVGRPSAGSSIEPWATKDIEGRSRA